MSDGDGALLPRWPARRNCCRCTHAATMLPGDVFVSTHVCPHAPTFPHEPVAFMGSPVATADVNREEVGGTQLDAVLVVDTTKGNRIMNERGFMISPTVKQGCIMRVSEDLVSLVEIATGRRARTYPLSMADITPYGNGLYHLNSILQPCTATDAPVEGVAITTETAVPGCATGATHLTDLDEAGSFMIEAAKAFGEGKCAFYDEDEYARFVERYGSMTHLQGMAPCPPEDRRRKRCSPSRTQYAGRHPERSAEGTNVSRETFDDLKGYSMDLQQRARIIIETNLALQPGETLLVVTDDPTREVGELFYEAARAMDHRALIMQMPEGSVAGEEPPAPVAAAMKAADVALCPTAKSITHTNARIEAAAAGTRVITMPGITMDMLRDGAACADYDQVERRTRQLTERLTHAKHARIEKDGHVLELALTGRNGVASPGVYREPGASGNFPSGEAYIAPLEDGANGTAVYRRLDGGIGTLTEP
ncbi:MAG: DUF1177 family protein [Adlercreutzia sp.]